MVVMRGVKLPQPKDPSALRRLMGALPRRGKGLLLYLHQNADLDAVGSAIGLKGILPHSKIGAHQSVSLPAKQLAESLGEVVEVDPPLEGYRFVLIMDTSNPSQIGLEEPPPVSFGILDHHQETYTWPTPHIYVDPSASSTSEIVCQYYRLKRTPVGEREAKALVAGIVGDTAKFRYASPGTLLQVIHLLKGAGITMEDVLNTIEGEEYFNYSRKIAHLKAAQRLRYRAVGDQVVAVSVVSSFEATAARVLLVAGADVALVGNGGKRRRSKEVRISARAKPHLVNLGLNLGEIMAEMAPKYGLQGGGHPPAAGMNGRSEVPLSRILTELQEEILRRVEMLMKGAGEGE
ncbi:hypothetical protein B6U83_04360 [Thermoplasmatales archaeon ex4484_36]|nr:MAG: hypothetical protein B6U83_04360 [Thermoplasmatales archaeon ex4484_36]RLF73586.1 MAG: hypothetical protein DRN55_03040 [Thermoplasmata archaeon]